MAFRRRSFRRRVRRMKKLLFGRRSRLLRRKLRRVHHRSGLKSYGGIVRWQKEEN